MVQLQGNLQSITNAIKTLRRPLKYLFDIYFIKKYFKNVRLASWKKHMKRHERLVKRTGGWTKMKTLTRCLIVLFYAFARSLDHQVHTVWSIYIFALAHQSYVRRQWPQATISFHFAPREIWTKLIQMLTNVLELSDEKKGLQFMV